MREDENVKINANTTACSIKVLDATDGFEPAVAINAVIRVAAGYMGALTQNFPLSEIREWAALLAMQLIDDCERSWHYQQEEKKKAKEKQP